MPTINVCWAVLPERKHIPAHTAQRTKDCFLTERMDVSDWPQNLETSIQSRKFWVYQSGRQFDDTSDLKECLLYEWDKINAYDIRPLISSVPRRLVHVIVKRGGPTTHWVVKLTWSVLVLFGVVRHDCLYLRSWKVVVRTQLPSLHAVFNVRMNLFCLFSRRAALRLHHLQCERTSLNPKLGCPYFTVGQFSTSRSCMTIN